MQSLLKHILSFDIYRGRRQSMRKSEIYYVIRFRSGFDRVKHTYLFVAKLIWWIVSLHVPGGYEIIRPFTMRSNMSISSVEIYVPHPLPAHPKHKLGELCPTTPPWCPAQVFNIYNPRIIVDRRITTEYILHSRESRWSTKPY